MSSHQQPSSHNTTTITTTTHPDPLTSQGPQGRQDGEGADPVTRLRGRRLEATERHPLASEEPSLPPPPPPMTNPPGTSAAPAAPRPPDREPASEDRAAAERPQGEAAAKKIQTDNPRYHDSAAAQTKVKKSKEEYVQTRTDDSPTVPQGTTAGREHRTLDSESENKKTLIGGPALLPAPQLSFDSGLNRVISSVAGQMQDGDEERAFYKSTAV